MSDFCRTLKTLPASLQVNLPFLEIQNEWRETVIQKIKRINIPDSGLIFSLLHK